jgi:hypothetical protein
VNLICCAVTHRYTRDKVLIVLVTRECYTLIKHYVRNLEYVVVEKSGWRATRCTGTCAATVRGHSLVHVDGKYRKAALDTYTRVEDAKELKCYNLMFPWVATILWLEVLEDQRDLAITEVVCLLHIITQFYTSLHARASYYTPCVIRAQKIMIITHHYTLLHSQSPMGSCRPYYTVYYTLLHIITHLLHGHDV